MSTYRIEWPCCGDVTETQAWEPAECPFCARLKLLPAADTIELPGRTGRPLTGPLWLDLEASDAQAVPSFTEVSRG